MFLDFDFNLSLFTTHGLFKSKIHMSASFPLPRLPLSIPSIFDGLEVIDAINFSSLIDFLDSIGLFIIGCGKVFFV